MILVSVCGIAKDPSSMVWKIENIRMVSRWYAIVKYDVPVSIHPTAPLHHPDITRKSGHKQAFIFSTSKFHLLWRELFTLLCTTTTTVNINLYLFIQPQHTVGFKISHFIIFICPNVTTCRERKTIRRIQLFHFLFAQISHLEFSLIFICPNR